MRATGRKPTEPPIPYAGPSCPGAPADVTGPAYVSAYVRGWDARNDGKTAAACRWVGTTAQPQATYRKLWLRGFNDCGRARLAMLRERTKVTA